jgi:hypothetical protein
LLSFTPILSWGRLAVSAMLVQPLWEEVAFSWQRFR